MAAQLEVPGIFGRFEPLLKDRVAIGKDPQNDVVLEGDPTVSRLHAALERFPSGWVLKDVGSRNGTFVNGERLVSERVLRRGDELRFGGVLVIFHDDPTAQPPTPQTAAAADAPSLTKRERDLLVALCSPVFSGDVLTEPATVRQMAGSLGVSQSAVKKHLGRLYDKFGLVLDGERRRGRLANEAIRRGAITLGDVRATPQR